MVLVASPSFPAVTFLLPPPVLLNRPTVRAEKEGNLDTQIHSIVKVGPFSFSLGSMVGRSTSLVNGVQQYSLALKPALPTISSLCLPPEVQDTSSLNDLVSRSFLFSLWWKALILVTSIACVVVLLAVRVGLRAAKARRATNEPNPLHLCGRLRGVKEGL
jgi:hypothetical protein